MDAAARHALSVIKDCVRAGQVRMLPHFVEQMDARGLFWPDVLAVVDEPSAVLDDGRDKFGRPKWRLRGHTTDRLDVEIVCAIDRDENGIETVFITAYWR